MKKVVLSLAVLLVGLANAQTGKVGINTETPTETLQVDGTLRVKELPLNGTASAINTQTDGSASSTKDQTFTATKTVVVDNNGVMGTVDGVAVTQEANVKSIEYVAVTVPINNDTPTSSLTTIGNISVRFNGTNPGGGEHSLSFRLNVKDNVIANQLKIGSGGIYAGQNRYFSASQDQWYEMTSQKPNIGNYDYVSYNIVMINSHEVYRLTVSSNKAITAYNDRIASPAQVTLFLERLSNQ